MFQYAITSDVKRSIVYSFVFMFDVIPVLILQQIFSKRFFVTGGERLTIFRQIKMGS